MFPGRYTGSACPTKSAHAWDLDAIAQTYADLARQLSHFAPRTGGRHPQSSTGACSAKRAARKSIAPGAPETKVVL